MTNNIKAVVFLCISGLSAGIGLPLQAVAGVGVDNKIGPGILNRLHAFERADIIVELAGNVVLSQAKAIADRAARATFVKQVLAAHARASQAEILGLLAAQGVAAQGFWINNSILVRGASRALIEALAGRTDVARLELDAGAYLIEPVALSPAADRGGEGIEWNIEKIDAPAVWATGNRGEGIVVANIDSGVRYTHDALAAQYRGTLSGSHDYNWWDPDMEDAEPTDTFGHGTHTMGTMVGDDGGMNRIGVAPGATWIAAQGCDDFLCSPSELISSAQWIACPTRLDGTHPDCSKAPHLVNNSWGVAVGQRWYRSVVRSWLAAGIVPVFAAGNSGPDCDTLLAPGDFGSTISVGATDRDDVLARFSSKGPSARALRQWQPDIVAPGAWVRSAFVFADDSYFPSSGTSMSAPHIAGVLALMLAKNPTASLTDLYSALTQTTVRQLGVPQGVDTCGGRPYDAYPNAIYGHGRVDAAAAVDAI